MTSAAAQALPEQVIWDVIDAYFNHGGGAEAMSPLVQHQIGSYNEFIDRKLSQIISGFNPIQICHQYREDLHEFVHKIYVRILNPSLSKPFFLAQDGAQMLMTPHFARMNNLTYASNLMVDVNILTETINEDGVIERKEATIPHVNIGKFPIMVRSKLCTLTQMPGTAEGGGKHECRHDFGGYFIINGNEKVVISQDRISENRTVVFSGNVNMDGLNAEIRSMPDGVFLPPKTCALHLNAKPNQYGRIIRLSCTFLRAEIPLFVMFRALGIESDEDIMRFIVQGGTGENENLKNRRLIRELAASADDASDVHTQADALRILQRSMTLAGTPREYLDQPAVVARMLKSFIENDFLPHVGHTFNRKALYLGFMTRKLLRTYLGYQPFDNRDSYIHKRIDTPGVLIGNLFRQCYGKMIKEMRNLIQRELHVWRASTIAPQNIISSSNVHRFLKQTVIESGMRYSLSTGNWGVKSLGSFQNIRQGVAQVLNRMSYYSTLSHLRRVNTPMEKNGKLVQPRKLENTQYGMICPAETPEGGAVGLVKNMAMGAQITNSQSSAYLRTCIETYGTRILDDTLDIHALREFLSVMGTGEAVQIMVNGDIMGFHTNPSEFYRRLKSLKRMGELSPYTAIAWDVQHNTIALSTEAGRMCRPLFIVDDAHQVLRVAGRLNIPFKTAPFATFLAPLDNASQKSGDNHEGIIEILDVDEVDRAMIAMNQKDLSRGQRGTSVQPKFTHCEIHPSMILGVLGVNIPFSNHNQAPRNAYQCLWEEELVWMADGRLLPIKDVQVGDDVLSFDTKTMNTETTKVTHQYVRDTDKTIFKITLMNGKNIVATNDHKFLTDSGWCVVQDMGVTRTSIAFFPKAALLEHKTAEMAVLTEESFTKTMMDFNLRQSLIEKHASELKNQNLLPLLACDSRIPLLAQICGYTLTDGSLNVYNKKHGGCTGQAQYDFGKLIDAELFENDVQSLGFKTVKPQKATSVFHGRTYNTFALSHNGAFSSLLVALGVSLGRSTTTNRLPIPSWIMEGSLQTKQRFVWGFQGGDGCKIRCNKMSRGYNFVCASTSQQANKEHVESLEDFMKQYAALLESLDVITKVLPTTKNKKAEDRYIVAVKIKDSQENLIKYFEKVHYAYDSRKQMDSAKVVEYLRLLQHKRGAYTQEIQQVRSLHDAGHSSEYIRSVHGMTASRLSGIIRSYSKKMQITSPNNIQELTFESWNEMVKTEGSALYIPIASITPHENVRIADITVESEHHSFIAGSGFASHNCSMGKQAVGVYMSNYNHRIDTMGHVLNYPQAPIVRTRLGKYTHTDSLPSGVNAIVAIMTYTGFNQEDSVMLNQSALDRGMFTSTYFKSYRDQCSKNHSTGEEEVFTRPEPDGTSHLKAFNYDKVGDDGFVPKNTPVTSNDVLVGKVMPIKVHGIIHPRDASLFMKHGDEGRVDMNYQGVNADGYKFCKIRLRQFRKPTIGDKVASRSAQKGTVGMIYRHQDMPFSKDGIVPDIIINPHAIPSRMTVAQLMECLMGKACTAMGAKGDATPFRDVKMEELAGILESHGMERYGNEILYDGRSGMQIKTEIFMGPTYYQRLKHMVCDKLHARGSSGPVVMLTRQPAEGRARNGGLRFGEMERDAIVAHGASAFLKERMLDVSDNYRVFVCRKCGLMCTANPERSIYKCTNCKNGADITQARIPYSMKLLIQELMTMSVAPRFIM